MDARDTQELLSTLHELKAELRRQEASLRAQRNETLVDFAGDRTPAHQATLNDLTGPAMSLPEGVFVTAQITNVTSTLADLEVTILEVERQADNL